MYFGILTSLTTKTLRHENASELKYDLESFVYSSLRGCLEEHKKVGSINDAPYVSNKWK
jgi:hypothetical protein